MDKKFDLSKSSDIRKLSKEIEKQAIKSVVESGIEIDCPHCNKIGILLIITKLKKLKLLQM